MAADRGGLVASMQARGEGQGGEGAVEESLAGVNPDELTAREALDLVYRLKRLLESGELTHG